MKRLVCEMCGGTDLIKQDGVFVCQSCGCKYSVEEARKMMVEVEGTIDVSGSTVKVDTSKRLENLYILARRARDNNNVQDAAKYYYEIRLEDPNSWEAAFYGAYFTALDCKIGQIGPAALSVAKSLNTVALLIIEHVPKEKQKQAYTEMLTRAQFVGKLLYNGAKNAYEDMDYGDAKTDFIDRTAACVGVMMGAGKVAEDFFSDYELARAIYIETAETLRSHPVTKDITMLCDEAISKLRPKLQEMLQSRTVGLKEEERLAQEKSRQKLYAVRKRIKPVQGVLGAYHELTVAMKSDGTVVAKGDNENGQCNVSKWRNIAAIACSGKHTAGLKSDGTVLATGNNYFGQCNVSDWREVVAIACGNFHTVGLKSDGTVLATGDNEEGECNVSDWRDVVAIACDWIHTVSLKSDGTVLATGNNDFGQCNVSDWREVVAIVCGSCHTVGLKSDGTVLATGDNDFGQCYVYDWHDIVAIACDAEHTVGLKSDGTVVAAGKNDEGQCNVSSWRDIVAIVCSHRHTVGLKSDGTVLATGDNDFGQCDVYDWHDIVAIACGRGHTVGLKSNGTVVATGKIDSSQCKVSDWKLFDSIDTVEKERAANAARRAKEREEERAALMAERVKLESELLTIKGLFSGGKKREVEDRIAVINKELAELE